MARFDTPPLPSKSHLSAHVSEPNLFPMVPKRKFAALTFVLAVAGTKLSVHAPAQRRSISLG